MVREGGGGNRETDMRGRLREKEIERGGWGKRAERERLTERRQAIERIERERPRERD